MPNRSRKRTSAVRAPGASPHARQPPKPDVASRGPAGAALTALVAVLALLVVARAALTFVPSMWAWSLNLDRFLSPLAGWGLWAVAAACLIPAVARRAVPVADRLGALVGQGAVAPVVAAVAAAALVGWLPDRTMFVGDFIMRQGAVELSVAPERIFPQALGLDVFLHYQLPVMVTHAGLMHANGIARVLGALDAAVMALAAIAFARALALERAAAVAVAAVVFFGGYLGMFTGYGKAVVELCAITALVGAFGLRAVRDGRGLMGLGLTLAVAFALHRAALGLIPAAVFVWIVWLRRHGANGAWRRPAVIAALAIPLATLALVAPRVIHTLVSVDATIHLAPASTRAEGGILAAAFAGLRVPDFINLLLLLSPLVPVVPVLVFLVGRGRRTELAVLGAIAVPLVAAIPFIHAAQGLNRDWDNFAFAGVATSLVAAWLIGETLRAAKRPWIAVAVIAGVLVPSVQWVAHHADVDRGLARVEAFMNEPPERRPAERAETWDFLGMRNFRLQRYAESGHAFDHAAELAPSPRILVQLAVAKIEARDIEAARRTYRWILERDSTLVQGWRGLATTSARLGDFAEARRAAQRTLEIAPGDATARSVLDYVETGSRSDR